MMREEMVVIKIASIPGLDERGRKDGEKSLLRWMRIL